MCSVGLLELMSSWQNEKPSAPSLWVPKYIQLGLSFHSMKSAWMNSSPINATNISKLVGQTRKHAGHTLFSNSHFRQLQTQRKQGSKANALRKARHIALRILEKENHLSFLCEILPMPFTNISPISCYG